MKKGAPFRHFLDEHLEKFRAHLKERGFTDKGADTKIYDIRAFFAYILDSDLTYH